MRRFLILLSAITGIAVSSVQASSIEDWTGKVKKATQHSFQGVFVHEKSGNFSSYQVWHFSTQAAVTERLLQLDGPPAENLRANGKLKCASAGFPSIPPSIFTQLDFDHLQKAYELRVLGESRVAGRRAQVIGILPRDRHRYGLEVHIDFATGVPLKQLLVSDDGSLLERFQYATFHTETPSASELQAQATCVESRDVSAGSLIEPSWHPDWVPSAFHATPLRSAAPDPASSALISNYSDGLASFSIFVEAVSDPSVGDARSRVGPTSVVSKRVAGDSVDYIVTVVGEIPLGTAERIALSVVPNAHAASSGGQ
jgi:sigma-E factor negative regulatory protein RseB